MEGELNFEILVWLVKCIPPIHSDHFIIGKFTIPIRVKIAAFQLSSFIICIGNKNMSNINKK